MNIYKDCKRRNKEKKLYDCLKTFDYMGANVGPTNDRKRWISKVEAYISYSFSIYLRMASRCSLIEVQVEVQAVQIGQRCVHSFLGNSDSIMYNIDKTSNIIAFNADRNELLVNGIS